MTDRRLAAILVAAGAGSRLGADVPKAFVTVAGATLLEHAAERFRDRVDVLVVVAPAADVERAGALVPSAEVVPGGETRQQSVACGLGAVGDVDVVLVHDVARPFVPAEVIERVLAALSDGADAVVPALPVTDTLRSLDGGLIDRARVRAVQTPQGFRADVLHFAHAQGGSGATDDATLAEASGHEVVVVDGAVEAFKITTPLDLVLAEAMLR